MNAVIESDNQLDNELTFSAESSAVLQRLRTSISDMLNSMPASVRSTRDLQKLFGLDLKLCWLVMKLAGPGDALSLAPFVPTAGPMKRFLNAASSYGITPPLLEKISSAYSAFEQQVAIHAGDRMTFESMATGSVGQQSGSDEDLRRADLKLRKAGFQMHSHYSGRQLDTYLSASLLHPGKEAGQFDLAHIRTKLGLRRLRAGADIDVDSFKYTQSMSNVYQEQDSFRRDVFDINAFEQFGAPILPRFCSHPLPRFVATTHPDGKTTTSVVGDSIGLRSSVNLTFGRLLRNVPNEPIAGTNEQGFGQSVSNTVPTMLVIADQLVHRPTFPRVDFKCETRWAPFKFDSIGERQEGPLPFRERIIRLEAGVDGARTREVPEYIGMLQFVCDQLQWKLEDFDVYRLRIEYPLLHTKISTMFEAEPATL